MSGQHDETVAAPRLQEKNVDAFIVTATGRGSVPSWFSNNGSSWCVLKIILSVTGCRSQIFFIFLRS